MSKPQPIVLSGRVQEELIGAGGGIPGGTVIGGGILGPVTVVPPPSQTGVSSGVVPFLVQPNLTESGSANYTEIGDMRQAASLLIYMGSPSRTFSIDATFVSRSESEAEITLRYINILRSWRMPEKEGDGEFNVKSPSRLFLGGLDNQFKQIPVRMTDLSIPFNEETDYIVTGNGSVPIVWNISVTLKEARSISELRQFNIENFRQGTLSGW